MAFLPRVGHPLTRRVACGLTAEGVGARDGLLDLVLWHAHAHAHPQVAKAKTAVEEAKKASGEPPVEGTEKQEEKKGASGRSFPQWYPKQGVSCPWVRRSAV